MVKFSRTRDQLSKEDIKRVEHRIGVSIPEDLKNHYLQFNGGKPVPNGFYWGGEYFTIQHFLPMLSGDRKSSFEDSYEMLVNNNDLFPKRVITFARDSSGDYYMYSLQPETFGHILFNQSEYYGDDDRFLIDVADSFDAFLKSLRLP